MYLLSGILYGGIIEELLVRLFLLTLLVWILQKIWKKNHPLITWIAIFGTALLFSIGHIPAAIMALGNDPIIIIRTIILNLIPGILFGYTYTKHGLSYSIYAHMFTHIFMQLVVLPIYA